jgi:serine/threonine protein kinase
MLVSTKKITSSVEETSVRINQLLTRSGSAWLVVHRLEGKKYIAKKVILEGLSDKEQEGCMLEVNLLKNLKHPNIVAYKESFL